MAFAFALILVMLLLWQLLWIQCAFKNLPYLHSYCPLVGIKTVWALFYLQVKDLLIFHQVSVDGFFEKNPQCTKTTAVSVADVGIVECGRCVGAKGNRIMKYLCEFPAQTLV